MPTYEYACTSGHHFELFQRISDKPRGKCPTCGAKATRKISGGAGLVFKGSGFYITDYGKDGKGPKKQMESGEPGPSAVEGSAKPAEKTPDAKVAKTGEAGGAEKPKTEARRDTRKTPKPHGKKHS